MMGDSAAILRPHHIEEVKSKMSESVICHCWGLQEELRELAKKFPEYGEDRHIFRVKEFRYELNPHASNTTNNSVNFHMQSILPASTSECTSHHAWPAGCGNKSKGNITNERTFIETFNQVSNKVNKKYYSEKLRNFFSNCAARH